MRPFLAAAAIVLVVAAPALAQQVRIRGKVASLTDTTLVVDKREGGQATIALTPSWIAVLVKPIKSSDIVAGSFIGTTEKPTGDGTGSSLEVHVFPPGVKAGEGHYDWDLAPGTSMTNGNVDTVVTGVSGRELTVSYKGGSRKVTVPANVPIVQMGAGDKAAIKPGVGVFILAAPKGDGTFITNTVVTGENGAAPPM
jgi:hypothetical protein